jgi:hypothetical protein
VPRPVIGGPVTAQAVNTTSETAQALCSLHSQLKVGCAVDGVHPRPQSHHECKL